MRSYVITPHSRAQVAQLEPRYLRSIGFLRHQQEQAIRLSLLFIASFLLLSSPLSCEVRALHAQPNKISDQQQARLASYQAILQLIDSYYMEERHVSGLFDSIMDAVLAKLDPHSYYNEPAVAADRAAHIAGERSRYGFSYNYYDGRAVITTVLSSTPAASAGLLPGDRIDVIWGQPIETLSEKDLDDMIGAGPSVEMIVTRNGGKKRLRAKMEREVVYEHSVEIKEMLDHVTGYIYLSGFIASSYSEMKRALEDMTAAGMKRLIFDLRGNGGGLLTQANEIAGLFLPFHSKLVGEKGRGAETIAYDTSYMPGRFTDLDLVVLIDGGSASATEIVAGILQDHDRALIVGEQSYGKGLYQQVFDLPDGGSFALSRGTFHLPSGRCTQRRYHGDTLLDARIELPLGDNRDHTKDTLLRWDGVYHTAKGRTVYGGQGIVPEVVVKNDTVSTLVMDLWQAKVFDRFMDTILNLNAEVLKKKYPDVRTFVEHYEAKAEMLPLFTKFANRLGVKNAGRRIEQQKTEVLANLKRWLSYRIFPENGWKRSGLADDRQFEKAIKQLEYQLVVN